jgi:hypothetical protein
MTVVYSSQKIKHERTTNARYLVLQIFIPVLASMASHAQTQGNISGKDV